MTEGVSGDSAGQESACNAGDPGLILGWGRSLGEEKSYPLQYSGLDNSMDDIDHGVTNSWTRLRKLSLSQMTEDRSVCYTSTNNFK